MKKKSQIQMMETIAVLFIFFILVVVGMVFFLRIMQPKIQDDIDKFKELGKIEISQIGSSLPELQCSEDNILKSNCIDLLKLEASSKEGKKIIYDDSANYFNLFSYSRVTIEKIFPEPIENWVLYDMQPKGEFDELPTYYPISLYDARNQHYYFGVMVIMVYT